ncbi:MAG: peptidylprolyl isomerase [Candidatus Rokubacteria bacterium]|nr:peptidylprolyl isomerase [Candidatus Rokubacteria bacterium]
MTLGARVTISLVLGLVLGGCAMPAWVPWLGKKPEAPAPARVADRARTERAGGGPRAEPAPEPPRLKGLSDDVVSDRIVAIVNNDAITLGEVLESIAVWRRENRERSGAQSDQELATQFLNRLIDTRLQLQEAERERITIDESEVLEELTERVKKLGSPSLEAFEASAKAEGVTLDSIKKRVRDSLRMSRIVRRKVSLRISVTEEEIDRYLEANRLKLETGLSYHARHVLLVPETPSEASWDAAKARAEAVRAEALAGADFIALARQYSADVSAKDGGDLGTLKRGELAVDIENQILRLAVGEVSAPYRSSLGWHVFRLEAKESLEGDALARARQQIRDILFREKFEARLDVWLKEIKQRAIIEVRM